MAQEFLGAGLHTFGSVDIIIFVLFLALGAFIAIYFAYFAPKGSNEEADYLVGDRNMGIFPIAMSLVASGLSGISMIAYPAEVSVYGWQLMFTSISRVIAMFIYSGQYLPVFHSLKGLSVNEYFVNRFDRRLRMLGSVLYVIVTMSYLAVVIYVPALAFEQVSGYNVHFVTPIICLFCIFFTSIGGIKALVWTDVIRTISMIICLALIAIKGTLDVGGLSEVWQKNVATGRIEPPNFDLDPTVRQTIFSLLLGCFFQYFYTGFINQGMVQRHQCLQTLDRAKRSVWLSTGLHVTTFTLAGYCGLVIAAKYYDCDPVVIQIARTRDQLVPIFVMESLGRIPGLTGFFIAGIFSASLSAMSTGLNAISAVFVQDWIRGWNLWDPTEQQASWTMKIVVVVMGILVVALVFIVEKLGMAFQLSLSIQSISAGPMFLIIFMGLFMPWVTGTGALVGAAVGVLSLAPIMIPAQVFLGQGLLHFPAKPVSVEGCSRMYNVSQEFISFVKIPEETLWPMGATRGDVPYPFRLSYLYYTPISIFCGLVAAMLYTVFVSRTNLERVDRRFIAPCARRWLPQTKDVAPDCGSQSAATGFEVRQLQSHV